MAKFTCLGPPSGELATDFWRSFESARGLLETALPQLKCPVCGNESFVLVRDFSSRLSPRIPIYGKDAQKPTGHIEAVTIHCDDCGNFLFFSEDELLKRAERMT